jgi:hypothetical protein
MTGEPSNYDIGVLAGSLRGLQDEVRQGFTNLGHRMDGQSKRLGVLERWRAYITGAIAVLTFIVTLLGIARLVALSRAVVGEP